MKNLIFHMDPVLVKVCNACPPRSQPIDIVHDHVSLSTDRVLEWVKQLTHK